MNIDAVVRAAIAGGALPPTAVPPPQEARPWPVVLLTGLGAWLATVPLLAMVAMLLGDLLQRGFGPYFVAALVLSAAVVVLRSHDLPLFVEQLAVPALLVGGGSLGFGVFRDWPDHGAAGALAVAALVLAGLIPRAWLRVLLGALAATLTAWALQADGFAFYEAYPMAAYGIAWHLVFSLWLLVQRLLANTLAPGGHARAAVVVEPVASGWLLAVLAGLAWWSGMTVLVGAGLGEMRGVGSGEAAAAWRMDSLPVLQGVSVLLALAGAGVAARAWATLRHPWCAGVAAVLVALAWFMPALGAVLLALGLCVTAQRWRLAAAAALSAAWIVGAFYYQLAWPLATKAVVLIGAGTLLGALAWRAQREQRRAAAAAMTTPPAAQAAAPRSPAAFTRALIAGCAAAVLAVANVGIWQKEDLIARGRPVYVELAPVDPRSLMQGDYMALNFRVPDAVSSTLDSLVTTQRPRIVARRDARGVAVPLRLDEGQPLAADEIRIELTPKNGRWILVSDAWFFREGDAQRWAAARYGEFRVAADGRALLVGMADDKLQAIAP